MSVKDSATFSLHKFHILNTEGLPANTVSLWAENWKEAIKVFRGMNPGVMFMTDVELKVRGNKPKDLHKAA